MIALALATGISPAVWRDESDEALATAIQLLEERAADV